MLSLIYWCKTLTITNTPCWIAISAHKIMVRTAWYLILGNNIEFVFDTLD